MFASALLTVFALTLPLNTLALSSPPHPAHDRRASGNPGEVLAGAPVNNITVSASNIIQCADATISWTGTAPPVTLMIGIGGYYVGTTPLSTIPSLFNSQYSWTVTQPAGTDLIFQVTDANGEVGYAQNYQVGGSDDASCLGATTSATANATANATARARTSPTTFYGSSATASTRASMTSASTTTSESASASWTDSDAGVVATTSSDNDGYAAASPTTSSSTAATTTANVVVASSTSGPVSSSVSSSSWPANFSSSSSNGTTTKPATATLAVVASSSSSSSSVTNATLAAASKPSVASAVSAGCEGLGASWNQVVFALVCLGAMGML